MRGVRGATTVEKNEKSEILEATYELFDTMQKQNSYNPEDISHVIISMTQDLNAAFPAVAMRQLKDYDLVPVMCTQEVPVPGSLEKCIRVMVTINTSKGQGEINHVYLNEAIRLRPDLSLTNKVDSR